jgi:hypothetical protein
MGQNPNVEIQMTNQIQGLKCQNYSRITLVRQIGFRNDNGEGVALGIVKQSSFG